MTLTSAPGAFSLSRHEGGFTFVEILVVLLVIGIVAAVAALGISPNDRQETRIEASRLADLLEEAAIEAGNRGETLAWSGKDDFYTFWQKADDGTWNEIVSDDLFRGHALQGDIRIDGISVSGAQTAPGKKIVFSPSGVNRPFTITLAGNRAKADISGDVMNRVSVDSHE